MHPFKLNTVPGNEDDPSDQLQTINNASGPSTSSVSFISPSQSVTSKQCSEPPSKRPRQLTLFGSTKNKLTDTEIKEIDKCVVKIIVSDYQPHSIVENVGFLEYTKKLQPLYSVPSRKLLTTKFQPQEYNVISSKLKLILENVNDLSITTDMWTSDCNTSYLTVTCHFIHNNRSHSPVLATREVKDSHTGLNIATALTHIFNEWSIANKIVTIVSDNGSNIKNAINEHLLKYHHPCVAHTLNLSVNEAINGNFDVKQDVSTRWNSSLTMIERLLTIKIPLTASMSSLPRAPDCLNASEWEVISDCVNILKPFENITSELSGENCSTISLVIPLIRGLQYMLKNLRTETTIGIEFKNKLIDVVGRRLGNLEKYKIVAKTTLLDPRLKKTAFGLQENTDNAHKWICEELTNMIRAKNDNTEITESDTTQSTLSANICSVWKHFDDKVAQIKITSNPNATASIMIRQYLEIPPLDRKKNP
ncbi:hypothetical protein QTP88_015653 [Uroleucon formosanum]